MSENPEVRSAPEHEIRSPDEILAEVDLSTKELQGKSTLVFGEKAESIVGKIPEAKINEGNWDFYDDFGVFTPEEGSLDYFLALDSDAFREVGPEEVTFLQDALYAIKETGEIRISFPSLAFPSEEIREREREYEMALEDRQLNTRVAYVIKDPSKPYYVSIRHHTPKQPVD